MSKTILWGINEQSKLLIYNGSETIDYVFDKFSKEDTYLDLEIISDIGILKKIDISKCIVSSTSYYFEIKEEIQNINKNIEVIYIGEYFDSYPKTIMIENETELINSNFINTSISGKVVIENGLIIQLLHNIPVSINVDKNAELYFNNNVLMDGVEVSARGNSKIILGNKTYINKFGIIRSKNLIEIGDNCAIAWNVTIMDNDGYNLVENNQNHTIVIGSNVWIGNNVNILKNTNIGDWCSVGSMSKVKGIFINKCLIAGNPAKIIKENISWK